MRALSLIVLIGLNSCANWSSPNLDFYHSYKKCIHLKQDPSPKQQYKQIRTCNRALEQFEQLQDLNRIQLHYYKKF